MGERTSVRWIEQKWVSRRKVKKRRVVGRKTNNFDPLTKRSEPRRAPPAKASQEPVSKARLAMCPLILNLAGPHSCSARSWGRRADLGLLAQPRQGGPFPKPPQAHHLTPLLRHFSFLCVCFLCSWPPTPPATFVD